MDDAHKKRKEYLEGKDSLDENEAQELENIKKHEASFSNKEETGDSKNAGDTKPGEKSTGGPMTR
jgi:hypothetical protein